MPNQDPVVVVLQFPIEGPDGEEIKELEVKRPKGEHMWRMNKMNMAAPSYKDFVEVVSICQNLPLSTVKKMDGADVMAVGEALMTFLSSSLQTGGRSGLT